MTNGFCSVCRKDVTTADDNKCPTCGTLTIEASRSRPPAVYAVPEAPQAPATPTRDPIPLPESRASRMWLKQTEALLADLERQEQAATAEYQAFKADAETRLREKRAHVETVRKSAAAVRQMLSFVALDDKAPPPPKAASASLNGRWSRQYDACVQCGTTERKHLARGLCVNCYERQQILKRKAAS